MIEILVVLIVISLIAGLVAPPLFNSIRRVEISAQRQNVVSEIAQLGYRAYLTGQPFVLGQAASPVAIPNIAPTPSFLAVPEGWQIEAAKPITYNFSGVCSGGEVTLIDPDGGRQTLVLRPPRCLPEMAANG